MVTPPERSGSDLLMQSAGLLIICHMREETTRMPTNFTPDGIVEDRFIGRITYDTFDCKNRQDAGQIPRDATAMIGFVSVSRGISECT